MYPLTTIEDTIKLQLFTLACHGLLIRLAHLRETTQQVPPTYHDCLDKFNHELQDMLTNSFQTPMSRWIIY